MTFLLLIIQVICRLPSEVANLLREGGMAPLLSSSLTLVSLALFLLYVPFSWSYAICFLRNHRDERTDINDLLPDTGSSAAYSAPFSCKAYTLCSGPCCSSYPASSSPCPTR